MRTSTPLPPTTSATNRFCTSQQTNSSDVQHQRSRLTYVCTYIQTQITHSKVFHCSIEAQEDPGNIPYIAQVCTIQVLTTQQRQTGQYTVFYQYNFIFVKCLILHYFFNKTVVNLTLCPVKVPVSCRTATLNGAHHVWNSFTHWCITVAGQTTSTGPRPSLLHA